MMSCLMQRLTMRTTLTIDDQLFAKAVALAEPGVEKSELIRECVKAFIQRQTARRLAALGGQAPDMELAPRRREDPAAA
jgi:Arc/MetJ family transcription regulator